MKRSGDWYRSAWMLVLGLYVFVSIAYVLGGAAGIRIGGAALGFNRASDNVLYEIDDRRAFLVRVSQSSNSESFSVVNYRRDNSPLGWFCGSCVLDGSVINNASYRKGDLVYSNVPHLSDIDVVDLGTGETFAVDVAEPPAGQRVDPAQIPLYRELGLTFDPEFKLSATTMSDSFERLPAQAESCIMFQLAFWFIFGVLLLLGIPRLLKRVRQAV
ncbi:MAG: hypothetical protein MUD01_06755 [Chloroflexaceae bacterium]|jgi:hypothetical protein|nr:hypothetical protein [Chloroflexaceae bacterium]